MISNNEIKPFEYPTHCNPILPKTEKGILRFTSKDFKPEYHLGLNDSQETFMTHREKIKEYKFEKLKKQNLQNQH